MKLKGITVDLSVHTKSSVAKLKAIAKHTAALADELEEIDKSICPECGDLMDVTNFYADTKAIHSSSICSNCGNHVRSEK